MQTAIRNDNQAIVNVSKVKCQSNQVKGKRLEINFAEKHYEVKNLQNTIKNCCKQYYRRDIDQQSTGASSISLNFSDISPKADVSKTAQKCKSKLVCNEKLREIERHNEHFMKKLMKAKPTSNIKRTTSEMTLLQERSEKHVPAASILRRKKEQEINTINRIIQKKLNAIASKKN